MVETAPPLGERLLSLIVRLRFRRPSLRTLPAGLLRVDTPWQIGVMTAVAGLCGTGIVAMLNSSTAAGGDSDDTLWHGLVFVGLLLLYSNLQRGLLRRTSAAVEAALDRQRTAMAAKVLRLNLQSFETLPREQLQGGLARHYEVISEAMVGVLTGLQSLVLLVLTLVYLAVLSPLAALLSAGVFVLLIQAYLSKRAELAQRMRAAAAAESGLAGGLAELLDGFKELRLDRSKRAAVLETVYTQSRQSGMERAVTAGIFADVIVFSNSMAYLMGGAVVFLLPIIAHTAGADLPRLVAVVLFLIGPMGAAVGAARQLSTARFSITALMDFEALLDRLRPPDEAPASMPAFRSLRADGLCYAHRPQGGDGAFRIGPIDFEVAAGEVVFVTGGNGSGKTTALRVTVGLYPPSGGRLLLNGAPVPDAVQEGDPYREMFGAVFADAYLFRRPYGLSDAQAARFRRELELLGIAHKLPADPQDSIDPHKLSTGQRKRLALALALAEDRPVLVLDEWAADQDPQSREAFYRVLLPRLREEGKAVIAITHDDRYFDVADRRYHMEDGRMTLVSAT